LSRIYVEATPLPQARARFAALVDSRPLGAEEVASETASGRVTAGLVVAELSSPHYHAAAMDGYALRAVDTYGAAERTPVRLPVAGGVRPPGGAGQPAAPTAIPVDTGDLLPVGCDAVVPLEDAILVEATIELQAAVHPWQHVRVQGEDIVTGQVLFGQNHRLGPADVGLLLAAGVRTVKVWRRPVVTFIPTGDEVVSPLADRSAPALGGSPMPSGVFRPRPGQIIETNGTVARLALESWGATVHLLPPVPDAPRLIGEVLDRALATSDLVLIGAGSSAGRGDFTARVIAERGQVAVHGVAVRPGKPVVLGVARAAGAASLAKPVVGLPGYPVSSALALDLFVRPLVFAWQGQAPPEPARLAARLGRSIPSPLGVDEFVRVKVGRLSRPAANGASAPPAPDYVAVPLPRGAGLLSALSQADGTVLVPSEREGFDAGETVTVTLIRPRAAIDRALLVTGSHDLLLDLLSSRLAARDPSLALSTGRVGSTGGLLALRDGLCHLAGTHLLDEETGEYNASWVRRLLPGRQVRLLTLAWRQQGLMLRPGNPKKIGGIEDLFRPGVVFINRQRGSGTRVLLDYLLRRGGLEAAGIIGYDREEGSHLGVASAVASGAADAGLGLQAAAGALGLEFVPVAEERYDLAFLPELDADPRLALLREILAGDPEFRGVAMSLGGYDLRDTGKEATV
jgi:putative molybdopterin biosynthesis protein